MGGFPQQISIFRWIEDSGPQPWCSSTAVVELPEYWIEKDEEVQVDKLARLTVICICEIMNRGTAMLSRWRRRWRRRWRSCWRWRRWWRRRRWRRKVNGGKNERAALFLAFLRAFNETKGQIFLSSWLEVWADENNASRRSACATNQLCSPTILKMGFWLLLGYNWYLIWHNMSKIRSERMILIV